LIFSNPSIKAELGIAMTNEKWKMENGK